MTCFSLNPSEVNITTTSIMSTLITFIVGSTQESFTFPRVVIDKDTYLDRYLSFDGKKIMEGESYVLADEDARLFSEFHSFLLGGDFHWDEEICQYFAYMGYPNILDYPLDFWKIKLQDNWIRNNFYRLHLWQPLVAPSYDLTENKITPEQTPLDEARNLLLIEPGPYVGLVDLAPTFHKQLVGPPRTGIKDLEVFTESLDFTSGEVILAGGALVTLLYGDDRLPADLDFFITTKNEERATEMTKDIVASYSQLRRRRMRLTLNPCECAKVIRTENAVTIGVKKPKWQVVLRTYTCPSEVVHGFDLDACGIFYDGNSVWATQRAAYALQHHINFFDFDRMSPTYGYRLAKYASRGFQVWLPKFNPDLVLWDDMEKLTEHISDAYDNWEDAHSMPSYAPYFTMGGMDTQALRKNPKVGEILKKKNPLDLILFASYFKYLPNLNLSDYTEYPDKKKATKFPRGEIAQIPSNLLPSRKGNKEELTTIADWWEIVAPGYVTFTHAIKYEPDQKPSRRGAPTVEEYYKELPVDPIFNLHADSCQLSGLTPHLQWKSQNPMEQLTGTFQPTTIKDLSEWYDQALLYGETSKLFPPKPPRKTRNLRVVDPLSGTQAVSGLRRHANHPDPNARPVQRNLPNTNALLGTTNVNTRRTLPQLPPTIVHQQVPLLNHPELPPVIWTSK